jgi:hypothetical protein
MVTLSWSGLAPAGWVETAVLMAMLVTTETANAT